MTDLTANGTASSGIWSTPEAKASRRRRKRGDLWLQTLGIAAISLAVGLLGLLLVSLGYLGHKAFVQTMVTLDFPVSAEHVDAANPAAGNYRLVIRDALVAQFPEVTEAADLRALNAILTNNAQFMVRDAVVRNPSVIGGTIRLSIPASDQFDQLNKGGISRDTPESQRRINDRQIGWFDTLADRGFVSTPFNLGLIFNADSRFPELAGLAGAIVGTFYAILVCFLISFPVGIAAAIYLEEFAPRNRFTDLIEVNINNLAAVPSVVFGLLGLAVFLNFFGLPRSAPLVGGMVLALMTLPTMIIVTRAALKAVPPSIREAALGMGASKHQMILHHVLPLSMPGILTGTIIGLAHALGETAPLLLIGMNAFITSPPGGLLDASTTLPTQIFIWADSPERGFMARTAAGILVLLAFLVMMNAVAIFLRQRLERRW
jgi:phosphate transport system permease protein